MICSPEKAERLAFYPSTMAQREYVVRFGLRQAILYFFSDMCAHRSYLQPCLFNLGPLRRATPIN